VLGANQLIMVFAVVELPVAKIVGLLHVNVCVDKLYEISGGHCAKILEHKIKAVSSKIFFIEFCFRKFNKQNLKDKDKLKGYWYNKYLNKLLCQKN
jgi:hypothetical protein